MGPLAVLLVPRRAHGHWNEEAFARLRRRATWLAFPFAVLAGFLVILILALFGAKDMGDATCAAIWAGVTVLAFFFLRRRIERRAIMALRKTVHLHLTGNLRPPDETPHGGPDPDKSEPDEPEPGGPARSSKP
jgi:hypothetical protein